MSGKNEVYFGIKKRVLILCNKVAYQSKHQAEKAQWWVRKRRKKEVRVYFCNSCKNWHLTHEGYWPKGGDN